jgi:hypothetical protein
VSTSFDRQKFAELMLYIADRSSEDPRFGATKLNKILCFSDFKAFGMHGESITGATYRRLDCGPAPLELLETLSVMERGGEIERVDRKYFNYQQKVIKSLRQPQIRDLLPNDEVAIVDQVIEKPRVLNASEVSAPSHLDEDWQLAGDREVIPYESAYISNRSPTSRALALWGQWVDDERPESKPP